MKFSTLLPPANEVWGKVMFSQVFVCPQGGGWRLAVGFPACITGHMTRWKRVCIQGSSSAGRGGGGGVRPAVMPPCFKNYYRPPTKL